jgi:hypothetical protein
MKRTAKVELAARPSTPQTPMAFLFSILRDETCSFEMRMRAANLLLLYVSRPLAPAERNEETS